MAIGYLMCCGAHYAVTDYILEKLRALRLHEHNSELPPNESVELCRKVQMKRPILLTVTQNDSIYQGRNLIFLSATKKTEQHTHLFKVSKH